MPVEAIDEAYLKAKEAELKDVEAALLSELSPQDRKSLRAKKRDLAWLVRRFNRSKKEQLPMVPNTAVGS